MRLELRADAFKFLLYVSVKEGILALISVVSLVLLSVLALKGLKVVLDIVLA